MEIGNAHPIRAPAVQLLDVDNLPRPTVLAHYSPIGHQILSLLVPYLSLCNVDDIFFIDYMGIVAGY